MPLTILNPQSAMHPNDSDPSLSDFQFKILAQGDSWFSIGAVPPWSTSSIIQQLHFTQRVAVVNCAYPGITLADEVRLSMYFNALLTGKFSSKWDAILISGGGNDLIDALLDKNNPLLLQGPKVNAPEISHYINQPRLAQFRSDMAASFGDLKKLRASGQNKDVPVFFNTYDYPTPRNSPAGLGIGPWLWKALSPSTAPSSDWPALVTYLFDELKTCVSNGAALMEKAYLVNTPGVLTKAKEAVVGESGDWENEIHPTAAGYHKLAQKWEASLNTIGIH